MVGFWKCNISADSHETTWRVVGDQYSAFNLKEIQQNIHELSSVVLLERRTTDHSSSRRIMHLVPVFTLETNNECFPKFFHTDNASSGIKTANEF